MSRIAKSALPAIQPALAQIAKSDDRHFMAGDMASILVTRDQFNITPQGVRHKPTDASFLPNVGDPRSGSMRLGQLECEKANGDKYDRVVVEDMMRQLWAEYRATNSNLFFLRSGESDYDLNSQLSEHRHSKLDH